MMAQPNTNKIVVTKKNGSVQIRNEKVVTGKRHGEIRESSH